MIKEITIGKCDRCGRTVAEYSEKENYNVFNYEELTTVRHHSAWVKPSETKMILCSECFTGFMKWFHNPLEGEKNE